MDLIDGDWRSVPRCTGTPREPLTVAPGVARVEHHAGGGRRGLGVCRERVRLLPPQSVEAEDLVLVPAAGGGPGYEELPHTAGAE
jgi:hypothetical protein